MAFLVNVGLAAREFRIGGLSALALLVGRPVPPRVVARFGKLLVSEEEFLSLSDIAAQTSLVHDRDESLGSAAVGVETGHSPANQVGSPGSEHSA